jgi:hypothetical protein
MMSELTQIDLTPAEIRILTALIYEPVPRIWVDDKWYCPNCLELNGKRTRECRCGVLREYRETAVDKIIAEEAPLTPLELLALAAESGSMETSRLQ